MTRKSDISELERLHELLVPILSRAALGDFDAVPELSHDNSEKMNEVLAGVGVLLQTIREKITELEAVNLQLEDAHSRSLNVLDEVLRKSLEKEQMLQPNQLVPRPTNADKA